jgi:hypothetical protein
MRYFTLTLFAIAIAARPLATLADEEKKEEPKAPKEFKIKLTDADKAALEQIRKSGGSTLEVAQNDNRVDVAFHLISDRKVGNDDLKPLKGLSFIHSLNLRGTEVDDKGLVHLADTKGLVKLHLEKTKITDAGLKQLVKLEKLEYLNLYGTAVTNASIDTIASLKGLKKVYIWQTKIDIEGVKKLKAARPKLTIVPDFVKQKVLAALEAKRKVEADKIAAVEAAKKKVEDAKKKAVADAKKKADAAKKKADAAKAKAEADKKKAAADKAAADKKKADAKKK